MSDRGIVPDTSAGRPMRDTWDLLTEPLLILGALLCIANAAFQIIHG